MPHIFQFLLVKGSITAFASLFFDTKSFFAGSSAVKQELSQQLEVKDRTREPVETESVVIVNRRGEGVLGCV